MFVMMVLALPLIDLTIKYHNLKVFSAYLHTGS